MCMACQSKWAKSKHMVLKRQVLLSTKTRNSREDQKQVSRHSQAGLKKQAAIGKKQDKLLRTEKQPLKLGHYRAWWVEELVTGAVRFCSHAAFLGSVELGLLACRENKDPVAQEAIEKHPSSWHLTARNTLVLHRS